MDIYDWKAKRAGGRITVYGEDKDRNPVRVAGVDLIEPSPTAGAGAIATDKTGVRHWLWNSNALRTPADLDQR